VQLTTYSPTKIPDASDKTKFVTIGTNEIRAIKPEYKETVEKAIQEGILSGNVNISRQQWLTYSEPWYGVRSTNTISAAAPSLGGRVQPTQFAPGFPGVPSRITLPPSPTLDTRGLTGGLPSPAPSGN
jgi:hypothetical protein